MSLLVVPFNEKNININVTFFTPEVKSITHLLPEDCFEGSAACIEYDVMPGNDILEDDEEAFTNAAIAAYINEGEQHVDEY